MSAPSISSMVWATDIDVLPPDRVVEPREGYVVVRSPSNPHHWWGNWLLFPEPPASGDGVRWEERFEAEFGGEAGHRAFGWDRTDGSEGEAQAEFIDRGYEYERMVGLLARPDEVQPHPRQNADVRVKALDPAAGTEESLWEQVVAIQLANRIPGVDEAGHEVFTRQRLEDLRALFRASRGSWYVALDPVTDEAVASLGIVVTEGRARFQAVDTAAAHRRRGICSRLVVEAVRDAARRWPVREFAIVAEAGYHALGLYQSLGFRPRERVCGVFRQPSA